MSILVVLVSSGASAQAPPAEDARIRSIVAAVSSARIESDIRTLVDFGTRHTLSVTDSDTFGIGAARCWVKAELESISEGCGGCLEVFFVRETFSNENRIPEPTEVVSVVAIQRGRTDTPGDTERCCLREPGSRS